MEPTIIILLLILLVGILGVGQYFKERSLKSGKLALALAYERLVMKHKLQIEHVEVFENRIVALDRRHKKLLFVYHRDTDHHHELIALPDIAVLQLAEEREGKQGFIKKISLALAPADLSKTYLLCFYDGDKDAATELLPAMRRARNWKQRVDSLRNSGTLNRASEYAF